MSSIAIELKNPAGLLQLEDLLRRAIEATPSIAPHGFDSVTLDLWDYVVDDGKRFFLAGDDGEWQAMALLAMPQNRLFPYPQLVVFYNEGPPEIGKALAKLVKDTISEAGFGKGMTVNTTGHSTKVWQRAFVPEREVRVVGELLEVTF